MTSSKPILKKQKWLMVLAVSFAAILSSTYLLWAWGFNTHTFVNEKAVIHLPAAMSNFALYADFFAVHAVDPDLRKAADSTEAPRHYIDIDNFSGFFDGTLPHDLDSLIAEYGGQFDVIQNGVVPFAIEQFTDSLAGEMAAGNWMNALQVAADLGHYVSDAHQPLHSTKNYNGQETGNDGIHGRYESEMMNRHLADLAIFGAPAVYIGSPVDFAFEFIEDAWVFVDSIIAADNVAFSESGGVYDDVYYDALWRETGSFTPIRIQAATEALASLWYTAWENAGTPSIPADLFPTIPISQARADLDNDFIPDLLDSTVTITGVITSPDFVGGGPILYYLQDATAGIALFATDSLPLPTLNMGDSVQITGKITQFNGATEIQPPSAGGIQILGTGAVPAPQAIAASALHDIAGEAIEGSLAILERVTIVPGDTFPPLGSFATIRVVDALGDTADVFIDNDTDIDGSPTPDGILNLTGIATQFDTTFPPDGGYNLRLRSLTDIVVIAEMMPISEARADLDNDFIPDLLDSIVAVAGVITSPDFAGSPALFNFLQDYTAGFSIFAPALILPPALDVGDSVRVIGRIAQFNGLTQIHPDLADDIQILGTGTVPTPQSITALDLANIVGETVEGLLVVLEDVTIVPGDTFPPLGSIGIVRVVDSHGDTADVFIDSDTDIDGAETPGGLLNMTGLASQFDTAFPPDAGYQLRPRGLSDIEELATGCDPLACAGAAIFPTPENGALGEPITGFDGDTIYVDIRVKENSVAIDAFGFSLQVNPANLAFQSAQAGDLTGDFVTVEGLENPPGSGTIICGGFGVTPIPPNSAGVLIRLSFVATCAEGETSDITISGLTDDLEGFAGCCNIFECAVCLSDGDVNNDGNLTPGDALCAFKIFLNGQVVPAECDIADWDCEVIAGDVNCDGTVTPGDALAIFQRFLSGLPPQECFAQAGLRLAKRSQRTEPYRLSLVQRTVLQSAQANGRDLIELSLRVDNPEGLAAFGLGLSYPAEKLDFLGIRRTALTQEWIELDGQLAEPGELLIGGFSIDAVETAGAGDLFELTFASKGQPVAADEFGVIELTDDLSDALLSAEASGLAGVATVPTAFKLYQSYPNPFQGHSAQDAVIRFDLAGSEAMQVELSIYNITGQMVRRLVTGSRTPGQYEISWDGRNDSGLQLPSGTYFYRLKAADFVQSRYLSVVR